MIKTLKYISFALKFLTIIKRREKIITIEKNHQSIRTDYLQNCPYKEGGSEGYYETHHKLQTTVQQPRTLLKRCLQQATANR